MNRVGNDGQGESVWLAWFLARTLQDFAPLARARAGTGSAPPGAQRELASPDSRRGQARLGRRVVPPRVLRRRLAARLRAERRVLDRRHRAVLGRRSPASGDRERARARARGLGIAAHAARARSDAAARSALRAQRSPTRATSAPIRPGIRENGGPVHARRAVDGARAHAGSAGRPGAAPLLRLLNPIYHGDDPRGRGALPRRAVRRRGRRVFGGRARRARRLDLVHGLGRVDVSHRARARARRAPPRQDAVDHALRARATGPASRWSIAMAPARIRSRWTIRCTCRAASCSWSSTGSPSATTSCG